MGTTTYSQTKKTMTVLIKMNKMSSCKSIVSKSKEAKLAKKIKELCSKIDLIWEQFASKVGVTFSTVNRLENGQSELSSLARKCIVELEGKIAL